MKETSMCGFVFRMQQLFTNTYTLNVNGKNYHVTTIYIHTLFLPHINEMKIQYKITRKEKCQGDLKETIESLLEIRPPQTTI